MRWILPLSLWMLLLSSTAIAEDWRVDPARSELVVRTFIAGMASSLGHDHIVRATETTGKISFDPQAGTGSVDVTVRTATLKADEPRMRAKYGLHKTLDADEMSQIDHVMKSEDQLDARHHPTIEFHSTKVEKQPDGKYLVTGNLTIRGVTKPVRFAATVEPRGDLLQTRAQLRFNQSSFGWEPYSKLLGALKVKDQVEMTVNLLGVPGQGGQR